jgi:hypothetical protein
MFEINTWWDRIPEEAVRRDSKWMLKEWDVRVYTVFNRVIIGYVKVSFGDGNEAQTFQPFEKSLFLHS